MISFCGMELTAGYAHSSSYTHKCVDVIFLFARQELWSVYRGFAS